MSKNLYIEPYAGIAGDMFVASLSGLCDNNEELYNQISTLPIKNEFDINIENISKSSIKAKKFSVIIKKNENCHHGRSLKEILTIINDSHISCNAKKTSVNIFKNLAQAEAEIHDTTIDHVHFHEVGAIDAIIDICSAAILLDILDVSKIISTPVSIGTGTVKSSHGILPVPCPATSRLLNNIPVKFTGINSELTTPTGAAILKTVVNDWNSQFQGKILKSGYGAGTKNISEVVNVLRTSLVQEDKNKSNRLSDEVAIIECNIDDLAGEHFSFLENALFEAGALDYIIIPGTMKKSRPGLLLQVICPPDKKSSISSLLLLNTSTIGIRYRSEKREKLDRKSVQIKTPLGCIQVKLILDENKIVKYKAEQNDISKICKTRNLDYVHALNEINFYIQNWINQNHEG